MSAPASYSYQWWRTTAAGVASPIPGATASTYVVAAGDVGDTITCVVTATNPGGSIQVTTAPTAGIGLPDVIITSLVSPSGTVTAGTAVTFGAVVQNQGSVPTPAGIVLGVTFAIDGTVVSASSSDTASLGVGASVTLTASSAWTATAGTHTLLGTVNAGGLFPESDSTNNTLSATVTVGAAPAQVRFVGFTADVTNRGGMVGKALTTAYRGSHGSTSDFPGGGSPQTKQNLPCNFESFVDYLSVFPWPAMIGCFQNQNDSSGSNVAVLYPSGTGGGFPLYLQQLTNPSALTGGPFLGSPYKNPDGSAATPTVPIISWDLGGTSLAAIAAGNFDTNTIIPAALAAKAWPASAGNPAFGAQSGGQVIIRLCHEMNGTWSGYCPGCTVAVNGSHGGQPAGTTCADFVNAWRHIVQVFANQGATNVRWHWCPNIAGSGAATPNQSGYQRTSGTTKLLYPGDAYVDYVGLDGYNDQGNWQSFATVFQASYNWMYNGDAFTSGPIVSSAKPMILGEIGCFETDEMTNVPGGQSKAVWFTDMLTVIPASMPNIIGVCYWHETDQTSLEYFITSTPASTTAWHTIATTWTGRPPVVAGVTSLL
jgi:hypothetical protein